MRALLWVAGLVAVVGMLWGSVTPARACQCIARTAVEYLQPANMVVVARLMSFYVDIEDAFVPAEDLSSGKQLSVDQIYSSRGVVSVERYLVGGGPTGLRLSDHGACNSFYNDYVGERHLFFLEEREGRLVTSACEGSGAIGVGGSFPAASLLNEVEAITGPGEKPAWDGLAPAESDADFPLLPAVAVAVIGPLALLMEAALFKRRA